MAFGDGEDWSDKYEESLPGFERDGFAIIENVLSADDVVQVRSALAPHLENGPTGRNEFEGVKTQRVYALLAKSRVFAELAVHPLAMKFVEGDLGPSCQLAAFLAINLHKDESAQPWHYDDAHMTFPRPYEGTWVSIFWAIDDMTEVNGATEILPGSHRWAGDDPNGALQERDFQSRTERAPTDDPGARSDAVKAVMPSGSMMAIKGNVWHRGGANLSDAPRLILTPQYCAGWLRGLENMSLAVPKEIARDLPVRAQELLGYSIHPPFMGYVDGVHPKKTLTE